MKPRKLSLTKNIAFNSVVVGEALFRVAMILDSFLDNKKLNLRLNRVL